MVNCITRVFVSCGRLIHVCGYVADDVCVCVVGLPEVWVPLKEKDRTQGSSSPGQGPKHLGPALAEGKETRAQHGHGFWV